MFRIWAKLFTDNHMIRDLTVEDGSSDTRTHKVMRALEQACYEFDLDKPIWLEKNIQEFRRMAKTRFYADNFIGSEGFDYLELQVIEED